MSGRTDCADAHRRPRDARRRLAHRGRADARRRRRMAAAGRRDDGRAARRPARATSTICAAPSSASRAATTRSSARCSRRRCTPDSHGRHRLLQQRHVPRHVRPRADRRRAHAPASRPPRAGRGALRHAGRARCRAELGDDGIGDDRERAGALPRARRRGRRARRSAASSATSRRAATGSSSRTPTTCRSSMSNVAS